MDHDYWVHAVRMGRRGQSIISAQGGPLEKHLLSIAEHLVQCPNETFAFISRLDNENFMMDQVGQNLT